MKRMFKGSLMNTVSFRALHVDTKGRLEVESVCGYTYFVTIVKAKTWNVAVHCVKDKSEICGELITYVRFFERQTGYPIREVHTDRGTEFRRALSKLE